MGRGIQLYGELIDIAQKITDRALDAYVATRECKPGSWVANQRDEILSFVIKTDYAARIARGRVLNGETIPNDEKIFSLFETHTELIRRGKVPVANEFGHRPQPCACGYE